MNSFLIVYAKNLDLGFLNLISTIREEWLIKVSLFLGSMGSPQSFVLLTIVICMFFWLHKKPYHLVQFLAALGTTALTVYIVKIFIARPRPIEALVSLNDNSFPSGHAAVATVFCSLIIFSYKDHFNKTFTKYLFIFSFVILALAISLSRVYLSVHYLSDVIVGIVIGLFFSSISVFLFESFNKKEDLL